MFSQPLVGVLSDPVMNDIDTYTFSVSPQAHQWNDVMAGSYIMSAVVV